jgi:hypothetical protein
MDKYKLIVLEEVKVSEVSPISIFMQAFGGRKGFIEPSLYSLLHSQIVMYILSLLLAIHLTYSGFITFLACVAVYVA